MSSSHDNSNFILLLVIENSIASIITSFLLMLSIFSILFGIKPTIYRNANSILIFIPPIIYKNVKTFLKLFSYFDNKNFLNSS